MLPRIHPDRIHVAFDDHRLVANVGLILHLDLPQLVDRDLDLGDAPGRANPGDKMMTLVAFAYRRAGFVFSSTWTPAGFCISCPRPAPGGSQRADLRMNALRTLHNTGFTKLAGSFT